MIHLRSIGRKPTSGRGDAFPFNLPVVRNLPDIELRSPVTFFVGENGSGKSTLLEAIAAAVGSIAVGGEDLQSDPTLAHARALAGHLRLVWSKRTRKGFFLRAEDVFNFVRRVNATARDLEEIADGFEGTMSGDGLERARGSVLAQRAALARRYGKDADTRSHGETFLNLFQERFVPGGLYLLDEPEAALSPLRQLSLLSLMKEMVARDGQFLVATHSPLLMAFPGATILSFDATPVSEVAYDDTEHVSLTRAFLNDPEAFLRRL
jgi:predicted ATPase